MKILLSFIAAWFTCLAALGAEPAEKKRPAILAIGAHMDDAEGGVGGILISAVEKGYRVVVVVAISDYTTWRPTIGREEQCKADQLALAKRFGFELRFLGYAYHRLEANVEFKRKLADIANEVQPEIVFVQQPEDHWPDHVASGVAGKDAVLFQHGLSANVDAKRPSRVFSYCSGANQTIRFEPDFYFDVTPVMARYMDLIAGCDQCLSGIPAEQRILHETRDLRTGEILRMSPHGWQRHAECVRWAMQSGTNARYAIGLKTVWGPRDGRALWEK
jgi:LmbE family N-acetylglucosaminyl deacetylase